MRLATVPPLCAEEKQAPGRCNSQLAQKEELEVGRGGAITLCLRRSPGVVLAPLLTTCVSLDPSLHLICASLTRL